MTRRARQLGAVLAPRDGELGRGLLAVGLGLVGQLAGVGLLASAAWLITTASLRPPVLTLTVAIAGVRIFALLRGTGRYGERLASHDLALRVLARIRVWAFVHLEPLVPGGWEGARRGDLLARFVSDVDGLQDLYVRIVLPWVGAVSTAAITVLAAALLDPEAGMVLGTGLAVGAVGLPVLSAVLGIHGGAGRATQRGERDQLVVELLHGASELTVFGAQAMWASRVHEAEQAVARQEVQASLAAGVGQAMGVALGGLLAAAVVAASLPAFDARHISGVVVAVLGFLALGSADAVSGLAESFAKLAGVLGGARRVLALEDLGCAEGAGIDTGHVGLVPTPSSPASPANAERLDAMPTHAPLIALEAVSVTYPTRSRPVLDQVSLRIGAGEHLALIGESGSGKTTLGYLLLGFVRPARGRVTFDGVDLADLDAASARGLVAWAPQDPHVFHTTLAANLRLARPEATDAELLRVLGEVGLEHWYGALPDGLSTMLGERGATISGGERQRLGVARALLADRPVLVLDEPTAHLDAENEARLEQAVLASAAGKTLLWITHRYEGLDGFDAVATLHRGHVALEEADRQVRRAPEAEVAHIALA